jgi:type IX secretion system PorP/SprF family membrane protein
MKYLLFAVIFSINTVAIAQRGDFDLTQRWFNETLYNPASAGNNFSTGVFLHTRPGWIGVSGSPSTHAGTIDTYIEELRSGIGLTFAADRYGSVSSYSARFAYAFYISVGEKSVLSLGLSGGILADNRRIDSELNDPASAYGNTSYFSPDFDFGFEFKGPFKLGASIKHLAAQSSTNNLPKHTISIWAYASSRFNISESLSLEPVLAMMRDEFPIKIEAGALLYFFKTEQRHTYSDKFWVGALYRTNKNIAVLAGVNLTSKIRLGYAFDYYISEFSSIAKGGTHELFLSFYLNRIFYKDETCPAYRNYRRR